MLRILHISDLHFGPPYREEVGQAVLDIAPSFEADVIVVSGDLTQRAKRHQFEQARAFMDQLPDLPRLVVPGNHDIPLYRVFERLVKPRALYQEIISEDLDPVLRVKNAVIVGIDSTSPRRAISNGRLHLDQLERCRQILREAPDDLTRIVVAHHHFAPAPDYRKDQTMPKARRAIDTFIDLGVEMILGGHLHRAYIGNSLDFFPGSHEERGITIVQSGTTTSSRGIGRERGKNSFNLIDITDDAQTITHYTYFENEGSFAPLSRHRFARPGQRFVDRP